MGWANTWSDILSGGNPRWKVTDVKAKEIALSHITSHATTTTTATTSPSSSDANADTTMLHIFCPLAGDDSFVHHAWSKGHTVTSIDLVPAAVGAMRQQFGDSDDDWTKEELPNDIVAWKHTSGRATLYSGDAFTPLTSLNGKIDAVYDKDSFGALEPSMRVDFCKRISEYVKPDGIVYTEVKYKDESNPGRTSGPPFHVERSDLMESDKFGSMFEYVASLGEVYDVGMSGMKQTGHVLRRLAK
eukprot:CAMPEP_0119557726 /NCGR_PEP_ID=MMETSP1352-20130426/9296_1 /TAXON_ID=265584 /ORGANISM="Stauroneis constricta, Strain CCMP1120" /LENGTH=243 /DNA_ID=CAMNT_0007604867 /DNA_START=11 /DNA_END=742 /DNA_ORIENTATION=+